MTLPDQIIALHRRVRALKRVRSDPRRGAALLAAQAELDCLLRRFWRERELAR